MNQNDLEIEERKKINFLARKILELANQGYSKGQILEYLSDSLQKVGISPKEEEMADLFSKMMDIFSRALDVAMLETEKRALQPEIRRLYQQMVDEKNLTYIGKDGRDYYSREALESANQDYMAQMYTENKPRTM